MSVRLDGNIVFLEGACRVEDAEALFGLLQAGRERAVNLTDAEHLHAAVLQILMALRPAIQGTAGDAFLRDWIAPTLIGATSVEPGPQGGRRVVILPASSKGGL